MAVNLTEIQSLIDYVEHQANKKYQTPSDFEELALDVFNKTKNHISVSTLKRLWGYVQRRDKVRKSTLDILANYGGWLDFEAYRQERKRDINSGFLDAQVILSANLKPNAVLEIGWEPNRLCRVIYQGDNYYQFSHVENSALKVGDLFRTSVFSLGQPLYIEDVSSESLEEKVYIAGKNSGLTILRIVHDVQQTKPE